MIYFTGDTHGEQARFDYMTTLGEGNWTKDDYLIVCGDFGYLFRNLPYEQVFLNMLEREKPYTICFCDGNHENFPLIYSYPVEEFMGGRVHRIRKNIVHLIRGEIYEIDGKKIFAFGGGYSRDRAMRAVGISYWPQEMPSNSEYREATKNLEQHGYLVDYIVSHTAPAEVVKKMGRYTDPHEEELNGFFDWVMCEVKFKKWFFGHWHEQKEITVKSDKKFRALYYDIAEVE